MFETVVTCRWCDWTERATVKSNPVAVGRWLREALERHVNAAHADVEKVNFCRNCFHDYVWHDMRGRCLYVNALDGKACNCAKRA